MSTAGPGGARQAVRKTPQDGSLLAGCVSVGCCCHTHKNKNKKCRASRKEDARGTAQEARVRVLQKKN